ncbi:LysR family transcriptional regulator [Thermobispora bispora]|uniref:Transcriptional regulator, LysR family n=1 Tax=Thermobispora bispora (strain ATCC 19993 / DSM 43833 / CBS 139.67 / JCM 10125 / KCTC 9307 / NBRC 14880 / R51) TaxID=469371 RepID=D6Y2G1_THEBD|nr:LysR family transcriptional regulator [Thermobispora bispora]ADG88810.1 transcriptional regulator, LysR family [Thermobispora bispora DSM 43833]MBO2473394.1 LysR family transcriptional regulator [Actinomycetales bacterium]MDI9580898.1 LysR substrate-binding domain-containing protein [Thermobispora sp.]QSI48576.1 LysR family transcriptional regulator [Thermobispora bispora]
MFDTEALRLFDVAARTGSFTAAAAELNYTQSAVSRRIAALEAEAGGPLFERLPRGVRLTPAGEVLHRYAREVLERLDRAGEELAALHAGTGGRLRVGAFATANAVLVPHALRAFRRTHPGVAVRLVEGFSADLIDALRNAAIDIAVVSDYFAGPHLPHPADDVQVVPLLEDELLIALPAGHRLAGADVVHLRDLREESWIAGPPPDDITPLGQACARAGFTPRVDIRITAWIGKLGYVAAGLGVTLVPVMAAPAVPADVVLRPIGDLAPRRMVYAALPRTAPLPAAMALLAPLREEARRLTAPPASPGAAAG